jgi:hypothetical protein
MQKSIKFILFTLSVLCLSFAQASSMFGPTRFTAQILFFQESSLVASGSLRYDWDAHEQRLELDAFNKKVTEVSLFQTVRFLPTAVLAFF